MRIRRAGRWLRALTAAATLGAGLLALQPAAPATAAAPAWTSLGGGFKDVQSTQVGHNADGRLEVFVLDAASVVTRTLYHRWQLRGGGWSGWYVLLTETTGFTIANEADGRIRVFDTTTDGRIRTIAQNGPDGGWGAWSTLATAITPGTVAAGRDPWGRLHAFVLMSGAHQIAQISELAANGAWAPIQLVSGTYSRTGKSLHQAYNADGRPEVFLDFYNTGEVVHRWQWANQGWSAWSSLGDPGSSGIEGGIAGTSVANQADGRIEVFVVGQDGWVRSIAQDGPNGGWSTGWRFVARPRDRRAAGTNLGATAVARNADGRLELFAAGLATVGSAVRTWLDRDVQSTGGSGWPDAWAEVTPPAMNHDTAVTTALDASGRVWVLTPIRTAAGTDDIVFAAQLIPGRWS